MFIIYFINMIGSLYILLLLFLLITLPFIDIFKSLICINITFFLTSNIINNLFNKNLLFDFDKNIHKIILINDSFNTKYCILLNFEKKYIFNLLSNIKIYTQDYKGFICYHDIYNIKKLQLHKKYYYDNIIFLLIKYSESFNKIEPYLLNDIKDFLYIY